MTTSDDGARTSLGLGVPGGGSRGDPRGVLSAKVTVPIVMLSMPMITAPGSCSHASGIGGCRHRPVTRWRRRRGGSGGGGGTALVELVGAEAAAAAADSSRNVAYRQSANPISTMARPPKVAACSFSLRAEEGEGEEDGGERNEHRLIELVRRRRVNHSPVVLKTKLTPT